jgi:peptidoglycan hydrolase-like protein with peptidoglycan-binding domain
VGVKPPRSPVIVCVALAAIFLSGFFGLSAASKSPAGKKSSAPSVARKSTSKSTSKAVPKAAPKAESKSGSKKNAPSASSSKKRSRVVSSRSAKSSRSTVVHRQTPAQPDSERIREIQSALAAHGYNVEPTGVWGADTVDALKKFQEAQNITNLSGRGKLDSLTLIALGLGPRRETPPAPAAAMPAPNEGTKP